MALIYHVDSDKREMWYWTKEGREVRGATPAEQEFWESLNLAIGLLSHCLIWREKTNWQMIEEGLREIQGEAKIK